MFEDDDDNEDPEYEYALSSTESDGSLYYEFESETELESADDDWVESDDSQATQLDSCVIRSMFEDKEAPPLFENDGNENDENYKNDDSSWLCLCCHNVGEYDTEDALVAHHSAHSLVYDKVRMPLGHRPPAYEIKIMTKLNV